MGPFLPTIRRACPDQFGELLCFHELAVLRSRLYRRKAGQAASGYGIRLEVVKLLEARRGFILLARRWTSDRVRGRELLADCGRSAFVIPIVGGHCELRTALGLLSNQSQPIRRPREGKKKSACREKCGIRAIPTRKVSLQREMCMYSLPLNGRKGGRKPDLAGKRIL